MKKMMVFFLLFIGCANISIQPASIEPANEELLSGQTFIYRITPDVRGGIGFKLVYLLNAPIHEVWNFMTLFDPNILTTKTDVIEYRILERTEKIVISEGVYDYGTKHALRYKHKISDYAYKIDYELETPGVLIQDFNYGSVQLESAGRATRITHLGFIRGRGTNRWISDPGTSGMEASLNRLANWETNAFQQWASNQKNGTSLSASTTAGGDSIESSLGTIVSSDSKGKRFAVVIGVSKYKDRRIPLLQYAARDAVSFHKWLVSNEGGRYDKKNVRLLIDGDASLVNIKEALFEWLRQTIEEDMITIYYSGHGSPESPDFPNNLFLLPYDTNYDRISSTAFPMWDIEIALRKYVKAGKIVVVADACHAGGIGREFELARRANKGLMVINNINKGFQNLSEITDGICVICASAEDQLSQEDISWGGGHGVFTHFFLNGLKGGADVNQDQYVTLGELIPYVSMQVRRATRNAQTPTIAGNFDPALGISH